MTQPGCGQLTAEPLLKIRIIPQRGRVGRLDERDGKPNLAHILKPLRAAVDISGINFRPAPRVPLRKSWIWTVAHIPFLANLFAAARALCGPGNLQPAGCKEPDNPPPQHWRQ